MPRKNTRLTLTLIDVLKAKEKRAIQRRQKYAKKAQKVGKPKRRASRKFVKKRIGTPKMKGAVERPVDSRKIRRAIRSLAKANSKKKRVDAITRAINAHPLLKNNEVNAKAVKIILKELGVTPTPALNVFARTRNYLRRNYPLAAEAFRRGQTIERSPDG